MSRTGWKRVERRAATSCGTTRCPANTGGRLDYIGARFVGQVKNPKRMSLAEIERLASEMSDAGFNAGKLGVLIVKRSAGAGVRTPMLYIVTEDVWPELVGQGGRI